MAISDIIIRINFTKMDGKGIFMARAQITKGDLEGNLSMNLDQGVGRNRPNKRDDVLFVQWLLEANRLRDTGRTGYGSERWTNDGLEIKRDGFCGQKTLLAIASFQKFQTESGISRSVQDGAIDPVKSSGYSHLQPLVNGYKYHSRQYWPKVYLDPLFPTGGIEGLVIEST
jgi:hypothetical protein